MATILFFSQNPNISFGGVVMYTYKAVNLNYYKYTVDGVNVIVLSILLPVL